MRRSLFFILIFISSVSAQAHRSVQKSPLPREILSALDHLFPSPLGQCSLPKVDVLKGSSCDQLFSSSAPYWVLATPQARFIQKPGNWGPVCSPLMAQSLSSPPLEKRADKVRELDEDLLATDLCLTPKQNLFSGSFIVESQAQAKVKLMNAAQRNEVRVDFDRLRILATLKCCDKADLECEKLMQNVEMKFCSAKTDPEAPDSCIGNGAFYSGVPGRELNSGSITLSPFLSADSEKDFAHELGHACSQVKRKLEASRGSEDERTEFSQPKSCNLNSRDQRIYAKLFASQGLDGDSANCFFEVASKAARARYLDQACAGGCASGQLEENFAEAFSLLLFPDSEWIPRSILNQFCMGERDSLHAHPNDLTACLLKTPSIWSRFARATGCKI